MRSIAGLIGFGMFVLGIILMAGALGVLEAGNNQIVRAIVGAGLVSGGTLFYISATLDAIHKQMNSVSQSNSQAPQTQQLPFPKSKEWSRLAKQAKAEGRDVQEVVREWQLAQLNQSQPKSTVTSSPRPIPPQKVKPNPDVIKSTTQQTPELTPIEQLALDREKESQEEPSTEDNKPPDIPYDQLLRLRSMAKSMQITEEEAIQRWKDGDIKLR